MNVNIHSNRDLMLIKIQIEENIRRGLRGVAINGTENRFQPSWFFGEKSFCSKLLEEREKASY